MGAPRPVARSSPPPERGGRGNLSGLFPHLPKGPAKCGAVRKTGGGLPQAKKRHAQRRVFLAEKEGFEPSRPFRGLHDFQSCALDQLGDFSIIIVLFFRAAISVCQNSNCYYTRAFFKVKPLFSRFSKKYCNSSKAEADTTWDSPDLRQVCCHFPHISAHRKMGIAIPGSSCYLKSIIALRRLFRGILSSSAV